MFQSFPLKRRGEALNVREINTLAFLLRPDRRSFETRQMSVPPSVSAAGTEVRLESRRLSTLICSSHRHDPVEVEDVCLIRSNDVIKVCHQFQLKTHFIS